MFFFVLQVSVASSWSLDDFKVAIMENIGSPPIPDINLMVLNIAL